MRVLVCGGRDYADQAKVSATLDELQPTFLIHGAARGADQLADNWAVYNVVPFQRFPANWQKHGRAAGPIRNAQMLTEGKPELVVAFPGGTGTAHMVMLARKAGVDVLEVKK